MARELAEAQLRIDQAAAAVRQARDACAAVGSARAQELTALADVLDQLSTLLADRPNGGYQER